MMLDVSKTKGHMSHSNPMHRTKNIMVCVAYTSIYIYIFPQISKAVCWGDNVCMVQELGIMLSVGPGVMLWSFFAFLWPRRYTGFVSI